jgi:DNA-binding transcriptional MerR regulator
MRIGEMAERAGTTTRTLRYYEARGLLSAGRDANGHRVFTENDLRLLQQIRILRDFGFELEDTRPFAECLRAGHTSGDACPPALEVYRRKIAELDACIAELSSVRDRVRARLTAAEADAGRGCDGCPGCADRQAAPAGAASASAATDAARAPEVPAAEAIAAGRAGRVRAARRTPGRSAADGRQPATRPRDAGNPGPVIAS